MVSLKNTMVISRCFSKITVNSEWRRYCRYKVLPTFSRIGRHKSSRGDIQLEQIRSALSVPLILGAGTGELADSNRLAKLGDRICLQGNQPIVAAVEAIYGKLRELRSQVCDDKDIPQTAPELMKEISRHIVLKNGQRNLAGSAKKIPGAAFSEAISVLMALTRMPS